MKMSFRLEETGWKRETKASESHGGMKAFPVSPSCRLQGWRKEKPAELKEFITTL